MIVIFYGWFKVFFFKKYIKKYLKKINFDTHQNNLKI